MADLHSNDTLDERQPTVWERRVPHIVGLYLAGSYTVFEMAQWVVKRFSLASEYEDMCLFGLLSLLPGVAFLAWGHGAPGRDQWTLKDKIGLPVNLLLTLGLLSVIWIGRGDGDAAKAATSAAAGPVTFFDAGLPDAATPSVAADARATVLAFAFTNSAKDPDRDWLQHAIPLALEIDLEQEARVTLHATTIGGLFSEKMRKAGIDDGLRVPLGLMRDIAKEGQYDHFVSGSYIAQQGHEEIELTVYDTAKGRVLATHRVEAPDLLSAVDMASVQLKVSLGLTAEEIAQESDLPVSEQGTSSLPALRTLSMALVADRFERDFDKGLALLDQALVLDETFAFAYLRKASMLIEHDKWPELAAVVQAAQKHSYRLSQSSRSLLQVIQLWLVDKKPAQALMAAEQWVQRAPRDVTALQILTNMKSGLGDTEGALAVLESLQAIEDKPIYLWARANMLVTLGRLIEARDQYLAYSKLEPLLASGFLGIAQTSRQLGEHDAALDAYQKALAAEPTSPIVLRGLAYESRSMGSYKEALKYYTEAVARSQTPNESAESLRALGLFYWYRGQMQRGLAEITKGWALVQDSSTEDEMAALRMSSAWMFAQAGMHEQALGYASAAEQIMTADANSLSAFKYYALSVPLFVELGDFDKATAASDKAIATGLSYGITKDALSAGRGRLLAKRDEFREAAAALQAFLKLYPTETGVMLLLAEVEYELALDQSAERGIAEVLRSIPAEPLAHLLMAKLRVRQGKNRDAITHLDISLKAWKSADEGFAFAAESRELRDSIAP